MTAGLATGFLATGFFAAGFFAGDVLPSPGLGAAFFTPAERPEAVLAVFFALVAGFLPAVLAAGFFADLPAADFGFKPGDVILEVAGKVVSTPEDLRKALGSAREEGKRSVLMRVKTEHGTRYVAIPLGRA